MVEEKLKTMLSLVTAVIGGYLVAIPSAKFIADNIGDGLFTFIFGLALLSLSIFVLEVDF